MTYYYAEVKTQNGKLYSSKLVGLHDSTSKTKPDPAWGGDAVIPISEIEYLCLKACSGNIRRLKAVVEGFDWLEGEE